jgi:hypothetical protein
MCPHVFIYRIDAPFPVSGFPPFSQQGGCFGLEKSSAPLGCDPTTLQAQSLRSIHSAKPGS